ncbi:MULTISPECIES: pyruvate kinase [Pseudofrankia]|uniref:pyruvate kinase n=1 Tax=Pseudofrankia TaxID=2994363 RepID=UPI000234BF9E|nr:MULTISPECIES: pyruvate kinase [Pseudofrankia]OHV32060.1 hypothetical protein BCD49_30805 [Pseudofrankia sp. EUN1h]
MSDLAGLTALVSSLRTDLVTSSRRYADEIAQVHPAHRRDAENLLHYLELRGHDMREPQERLTDLGLSSLGGSEGNVLATVEAVLTALRALAGEAPGPAVPDGSPANPATGDPATGGVPTFAESREMLIASTEALLGPTPAGRSTRIMVTLPGSAADDFPLVRALVERGMDCARINCAHDEPRDWAKMIANVRKAAAEIGRPCLVAMDLAGPKLRTGPLTAGPRVVRLRPARNAYGRVTAPAECWLVDAAPPTAGAGAGAGAPDDPALDVSSSPSPADAPSRDEVPAGAVTVPVPGAFLARLRPGHQIRLRDTRGAHRSLRVTEVTATAARVETDQTTYLGVGTPLRVDLVPGAAIAALSGRPTLSAGIGELPALEQALRLGVGDELVLTRDLSPAQPPAPGDVARIGCTLPDVFTQIRAGHRVWFDDGKIGTVVTDVGPHDLRLRVTDAPPAGARLRAGKGINLPDTELPISALTSKDEADLAFVAVHADIVSMSFVRDPDDVARLRAVLAAAGRADIGIILKIETLRAFANLPQLLLAVLRERRVGVMIARGDLAVECGYERLAELQEEILWLCEAAHVPVVWATQVLDQLARTGRPTRAEITDAAMSGRAECVMLNKGPHITDAVTVLDDVLTRMSDHQHKKSPLLRELRSWHTGP